ncbi:tripartite tricarboxylate transporter permease [Microbacterium thalli]|uniref:tripartite tricarboxylate transporter permease n=1 Tax=Microbacterium thalli TaxID=3027921 RepID=UPI0023651A0B|nr:tripartite tricarboxylate transporter permease [Microbacterium thalli]MDD7928027.1 tripartite tricarboxylate transporter permease [Microbacterium thalli]
MRIERLRARTSGERRELAQCCVDAPDVVGCPSLGGQCAGKRVYARAYFEQMLRLVACQLDDASVAMGAENHKPLGQASERFCAMGVYATSASTFELWLLLGLALLGFAMRRFGIPLAPLMIGIVLGPLAETSSRDALLSAEGDPAVFVSSPIAVSIYGLLLVVVIASVVGKVRAHAGRNDPMAAVGRAGGSHTQNIRTVRGGRRRR